MTFKRILITFLLLAVVIPSQFELIEKSQTSTKIKFSQENLELKQKGEYKKIHRLTEGSTTDEGMPELPLHTTFFQMKQGVAYDVEYTVLASHKIENVEVFPFQGESEDGLQRNMVKNIEFYNSDASYPEKHITVSEPMVMRDIEVGLISFVPFEYNASEKSLTVYDEVEFNIVESGERDKNTTIPAKRSKLFEPFYEDFIVDYEPLSSREEYQPSSILYICGGGSISHPYVQQLIEWREKQGYIVYVVSTNEVGGTSASTVENYIDSAYNLWDNPPEVVGLIGDTGGTYAIGNFTYSGGATDVNYSYISGGDFLPEVFVGRISVNSSSEISNVINKTLVYEKAETQADWWYERAALLGDPSSSGVSTITTMKYIQNIMENYGMTDIRTNYDNGNYDNWVENQFDDGILYYNYRGFYGSSGIGTNGLDSGDYLPFAASLTCGTGDFNGTSESESFYRAGSLANPQGAVAAVGVATTATHTAYNNIVHMGMYEGIFSNGMYHAGAAMANGKIALYRTYPTNPNSAVSKFSAWPNLIGDPALHLWTGKPHDFIIDAPASLPANTQNMEVSVTDENGNPVNEARITLILGGQHFTAYTDESGDAIVTWNSNSNGEAILTAFKGGFRLGETMVEIGQVAGAAIYVDQTRTTINEINGNGNFQLNPGEVVELTLPLLNFGSENAENVNIELLSSNINVNIIDAEKVIAEILSSESVDVVFKLELENNLYEGEDLDLTLYAQVDGSEWNISVPAHVYAAKLENSGLEVVGDEALSPGVESTIDLIFNNSGSQSINGLVVELEENDFIHVMDNNLSSFNINTGEQVVIPSFKILPVSHLINGSTVSLKYTFSTISGYEGEDYIVVNVGTREEGDPLGPDEHGYYIYDSGDVAYPLAPEYDWIEITGGAGGGQSLNLTDTGDGCYSAGGWYGCDDLEGEDTQVIQLPFDFQFYGIVYNEITVSTNGWIAFGDREMSAFRNYSIPGAGGPSPMVAAFWDDLTTDGSGQVYKLVTDDYVIIQWNNMRIHGHGTNNDTNTFQMILYNPEYMGYLTPTGDGEIKIQYKRYRNISNGDYYEYTPLHGCYSTTGIENHLGNVGLEYSFDNDYPTEAMELDDETAIFITTSLGNTFVMGDVNQDEEVNVLDVVTIVNFILGVGEPTAYQEFAGDMNEDDALNILDVVLIVNTILAN